MRGAVLLLVLLAGCSSGGAAPTPDDPRIPTSGATATLTRLPDQSAPRRTVPLTRAQATSLARLINALPSGPSPIPDQACPSPQSRLMVDFRRDGHRWSVERACGQVVGFSYDKGTVGELVTTPQLDELLASTLASG